MSNEGGGGSCLGCVGFLVALVLLCALLFGVNMNGEHHDISCGCDGVTLETQPLNPPRGVQ